MPVPRAHVSVGRDGGSDSPSHPLAPRGGAATCWRGMRVTLRDAQGRTVSPGGDCVLLGTLGHVWGHVWLPQCREGLACGVWGPLEGPGHPLLMAQDGGHCIPGHCDKTLDASRLSEGGFALAPATTPPPSRWGGPGGGSLRRLLRVLSQEAERGDSWGSSAM